MLEGIAFRDIARKIARFAHEAAAIEHQRQRHQRAVGALLLGTPVLGFGIGGSLALHIGVGQIVQRHRGIQAEQTGNARKQPPLNVGAVLEQGVRRAIQLHQRHCLEIHIQQFAQSAALRQPVIRRMFRGGRGHASDN